MTAAVVALAYLHRGWQPVPVPYRQKGPCLPGWQNLRLTEATLPRYFAGPMNIGVQLGSPSGGLADIDLDCTEALELAETFLPPTLAVFGRPSKPRSHCLYRCQGAVNRRYAFERATLVELRTTGCQTVFPGSTHPSGEVIEWASKGDPAEIDRPRLDDTVCRFACACVLVRAGMTATKATQFAGDLRALCALAESNTVVGPTLCQWLGIERLHERRAPARGPATNVFAEAVERYNAEHPLDLPKAGGKCPVCGHKDCFGRLPDNPGRWCCFSASHDGPGVRGPQCYHGDALDLDAFAANTTRALLLRREGYLA